MSRKKLPRPSDPLARAVCKIHPTIDGAVALLKRAGFPATYGSVQNWRQGRRAPSAIVRSMLKTALAKL